MPAAELAREPSPYVAVTAATMEHGRRAFYAETFDNEVFLTDVLGFTGGPLGLWQYAKAILALRGLPTSNLEVEFSRPITIGGRTFAKGERVPTGLDVPRGALVPLGMVMSYRHGRVRVGLSCAA